MEASSLSADEWAICWYAAENPGINRYVVRKVFDLVEGRCDVSRAWDEAAFMITDAHFPF